MSLGTNGYISCSSLMPLSCVALCVLKFQAPFTVEIHGSALAVTDIHSHICKTEVIGMLGGQYLMEQGKLVISMATPCNSISTGMQCEMDPGKDWCIVIYSFLIKVNASVYEQNTNAYNNKNLLRTVLGIVKYFIFFSAFFCMTS